MGLVEILRTLFNENLVLPDNFGFKKEVTLSLNIFFIKICIFKKVKIDDIKVVGDEILTFIFILEKRKVKTLV